MGCYFSLKLFIGFLNEIVTKNPIRSKMSGKKIQPATESEGLGTYILGLNWEYLASQIRQVPSSDDLQH